MGTAVQLETLSRGYVALHLAPLCFLDQRGTGFERYTLDLRQIKVC